MQKIYILVVFLLISSFNYAQETKPDTLKTGEILVVKPYTPKISDAFKINTNPEIHTAELFEKEKVNYTIFSVPVASTFTPSKGKVKGIAKEPKERLFENYISAGFGNYTTPLLEIYLHSGDKRYNDYGLFIQHHSSEGGIDDLLLDDAFSNTKIDGYYTQYDRDYNWQVNAGVSRKLYNYYGLPNNTMYSESFINSIDEKQIYKNVYVGGAINFEDSFIQNATAELYNFFDDYKSNELRLFVKPSFEFPISTELISANATVDFLSGKFKQNYTSEDDINYSFLNLGAHPNFEVLRDNLKINLGVKLYYASDLENKTNEFYAYPNVAASYKLLDEVVVLLAGIKGDLVQHTYKDFANENPYISPTLTILPTDKQYNAYIGAKGKPDANISYGITASYSKENNKPLVVQNNTKTNGINDIDNAYEAGNSFYVVYDDVKTLGISGELTIEYSKEFDFGMLLNFYDYSLNEQESAWNLPEIEATLFANYQKNKWLAGAKLFYRGETKDYVVPYLTSYNNGTVVKNDAYFDVNVNTTYNFSDRLSAFAKINNLLNNNYERFVNYKVQPLQILAGITYKFDF